MQCLAFLVFILLFSNETVAQAAGVPTDHFQGLQLETEIPTLIRPEQVIQLNGHLDDPTVTRISFFLRESTI
jgi:hypothetical protein